MYTSKQNRDYMADYSAHFQLLCEAKPVILCICLIHLFLLCIIKSSICDFADYLIWYHKKYFPIILSLKNAISAYKKITANVHSNFQESINTIINKKVHMKSIQSFRKFNLQKSFGHFYILI